MEKRRYIVNKKRKPFAELTTNELVKIGREFPKMVAVKLAKAMGLAEGHINYAVQVFRRRGIKIPPRILLGTSRNESIPRAIDRLSKIYK